MSGEIVGERLAHEEMRRTNLEWSFKDANAKLLALGVHNQDTSNLDAIVASRHARKPEIVSRLQLYPNDVVLDLGSGLGYLAGVIAPDVRHLHCCDISLSLSWQIAGKD